MSELHDHERDARLAKERPEVARRQAELISARAELVGELRGLARGLRLGRLALSLVRRFSRRDRD